ncbi:hypothetical protein KFK09_025881 [Dendrobium nobile]|uniref:Uncharacterized protein n=1 Tax=Dendrobium nobile TaxID=94219 RepID=A0A8T3A6U0_DENNO|nr:hypothetical protein KFK09_025881 [Dendrobium nobile]
MATTNLLEEPFVLSLSSSPRISISNNLSTSSPTNMDSSLHTLHLSSSFSEFDFKFSLEPSTLDPSPADELFSSGFLLPLPLRPSCSSSTTTCTVLPPPPPPHLPQVSNTSTTNSNPFTHFHRSFSLNCSRAKSKLSMILPFPLSRSYSTGSNSFSKQRLNKPKPHTSFHGDDSYDGARISSHPGRVFRFLLCSCSNKDDSKGNRGWL